MKARSSEQGGLPCRQETALSAKMEYIAFDCRQRYTWAGAEDQRSLINKEEGIPHVRGAPGKTLCRARGGGMAPTGPNQGQRET